MGNSCLGRVGSVWIWFDNKAPSVCSQAPYITRGGQAAEGGGDGDLEIPRWNDWKERARETPGRRVGLNLTVLHPASQEGKGRSRGLVRADFLSWVLPFPPGLGEPRRGLWDLFGSKAFSGLRLGFRGQFLASPLTEQIPYKQTSFSCLALGLLFPSGPPHGTAPSGPAPSPFPSTGSQPALQGPQ